MQFKCEKTDGYVKTALPDFVKFVLQFGNVYLLGVYSYYILI